MILFRYNLMRFLGMFARVALIFAGMLFVIGLVDELGRLREGQGIARAAYLAALSQSELFYTILPLLVLIASISLFLAMSRSSELVAIRAAGRSGLRFLLAPCLGAGLVGVVALALLNPIVTSMATQYQIEKGRQQVSAVLTLSGKGLWMRQGDALVQTIIHAGGSNLDQLVLKDTTFVAFDQNGTATRRIESPRAQLADGAWILSDATLWDLTQDNPQLARQFLGKTSRLATDITPGDLSSGFGKPSSVPIYALPAYIGSLEKAGFSARAFRVWFQAELAKPFSLVVMVLVAAGFTMRHIRTGNRAQMVLFATLLGFGLFFLRNIAQVFGQNGFIPVHLAAWGPIAAASLLALTLLLHLEEG